VAASLNMVPSGREAPMFIEDDNDDDDDDYLTECTAYRGCSLEHCNYLTAVAYSSS